MKRIRIVGQVRGFFKHLINATNNSIVFSGTSATYEIASNKKNLIAKLLRTKLVGFWGIFKVNSTTNIDCDTDYYLSFNRFLNTDKPYFIYLENPTALCNYSLTCLESPFVKKKLRKCIMDDNLKKIICMSKACESTLEQVLGIQIPKEKVCQIYPYVPDNREITDEFLRNKSRESTLRLLYIAQGIRFKSKGGLEVIEAFRELKKNIDVSLTIITNIEQLEEQEKEICTQLGISLIEFKLPYNELVKVYSKHHILLQPSSDDSFGLTVLEALKSGLPIIASNMYAFKEMVEDEKNGFLVEPAFYFFLQNDLPNPKVWNRRETTIYSGEINKRLVQDMISSIKVLYSDIEILYAFSQESLRKSNSTFNNEIIINKWKSLV